MTPPQKPTWAFCACFRLHYRYRYRYRRFGFFGTVTIIIVFVIVIVIDAVLALSYRNVFGFNIQHSYTYGIGYRMQSAPDTRRTAVCRWRGKSNQLRMQHAHITAAPFCVVLRALYRPISAVLHTKIKYIQHAKQVCAMLPVL